MFWGCFSYYGVGRLQLVEGMMKCDQYIEILSRILIPEMNKTFPDATAIFQHDHAPCHTPKKVKTFLQTKQITVLNWPCNSLDLSPIENSWSSFVKMKLREKDCTTKQKHVSLQSPIHSIGMIALIITAKNKLIQCQGASRKSLHT